MFVTQSPASLPKYKILAPIWFLGGNVFTTIFSDEILDSFFLILKKLPCPFMRGSQCKGHSSQSRLFGSKEPFLLVLFDKKIMDAFKRLDGPLCTDLRLHGSVYFTRIKGDNGKGGLFYAKRL